MTTDIDQEQEEKKEVKAEEAVVEKTPSVETTEEKEAVSESEEKTPEIEEKEYTLPDEVSVCPICGVDIQKYELGELDEYLYIACKNCGSAMVDPRVTQEEIDEFFGDVQPELVHVSNHEIFEEHSKKDLLKKFPNIEGKRFLDVGCKQGYSVMAAKDLGAESHGIDPFQFSIDFAKKNYDEELFENVKLTEYAKRGEQFDVVLSLNNICEQPEVEEYIKALSKVVSKGGKVYFEEPDGNSFFLPRRFTSWDFIDPPMNSIYVSRKGLTKLLKKYGLKVIKRFFTWGPADCFIAVKVE